MKTAFRSRRHRNPHTHDQEDHQSEKAFFSKSQESEASSAKAPFFQKSGLGSRSLPIQAKLAIGQPGDSYEREADAVADAVVNQPSNAQVVQQKKISSIQRLATPAVEEKMGTNDERMKEDKLVQEKKEEEEPVQMQAEKEEEMPPVQKMDAPKEEEQAVQKADAPEEEEPVQMQAAPEEEEPVQKMEAPKEEEQPVQKADAPAEEEPVQMQAAPEEEEPVQKMDEPKEEEEPAPAVQPKSDGKTNTASSHLSNRIESSKGKGSPLPDNTRSEMESSFGTDFRDVRIHNDSEATQMNKELGAHAFTTGQDIYFNQGKYSPESSQGKHLLAHELTHTVQQGERKKLKKSAIQRNGGKKDEAKAPKLDFEAIKKILDQIPTGKEALARKDEYKVPVEFIAGGGSYYDPSTNKMVIDSNHTAERAALSFVHEMNHAHYKHKGLAADISKLKREEYVKAEVNEEAEGVIKSIEAKIELEGTKVNTKGLSYPLEKEYKEEYKKVIDVNAAKKEGKLSEDDAKKQAREAGKKRVIKGFMDGEVITSTDKKTYPVYYGEAWDTAHKDDKK